MSFPMLEDNQANANFEVQKNLNVEFDVNRKLTTLERKVCFDLKCRLPLTDPKNFSKEKIYAENLFD